MQRQPSSSTHQLSYVVPPHSTTGTLKAVGSLGIIILGCIVIPPKELLNGKLFNANALPGALLFLGLFVLLPGLSIFSGLRQMLERSRVEFYRISRTARAWHGSFRMRERSFQMLDYTAIEVGSLLIDRGRRDREYVYPLSLVGPHRKDLLIVARNSEETRRAAEEIALFLQFDLIDSTSGSVRHDSAAEVGVSLTDRLRMNSAAGQAASSPGDATKPVPLGPQTLASRPTDARSSARVENGRLVVEIPAPSWQTFFRAVVVMTTVITGIGLVIAGVLVVLMLLFEKEPLTWERHFRGASYMVMGFGVIGLLIGVLMQLPEFWAKETLEVDASGIKFKEHGLFSRKEQFIPAVDIRELRFGAVITRDKSFLFGSLELGNAELEWLDQGITKALTNQIPAT